MSETDAVYEIAARAQFWRERAQDLAVDLRELERQIQKSDPTCRFESLDRFEEAFGQ